VLLTYLPRERRLVNQFAADHSQGLAGGEPLLALDMYEHAYHLDFGAHATPYVDAFLRNVEWSAVQSRYLSAAGGSHPGASPEDTEPGLPSVTVETVKDLLDQRQPVQLIDARPRHYYSKAPDMMAEATWRDPDRVREWAGQLSRSEPVLVYCAYGFHVGCTVTAALRADGFDARYVEGGLSAWKAMGGPRQAGPDV
jgi:Fe-Mn family superoxide dismutase